MGDDARIDVKSLEDFQTTLTGRLAEVVSVQTKLEHIKAHPPKLGSFKDAVDKAIWYANIHIEQLNRVKRLHSAIVAIQEATAGIIANYTTTEARNQANAADIAGALSPVSAALTRDA